MSYRNFVTTRQDIKDNVITIEADLPGYKKSTLELNVQGTTSGYTLITGKASKQTEGEKDPLTLVLDVNPQKLLLDAVTATLEDGVLAVKLPMRASLAKKAIKIL